MKFPTLSSFFKCWSADQLDTGSEKLAILIVDPYSNSHYLTKSMSDYIRDNQLGIDLLATDNLLVSPPIRKVLDHSSYSKVYTFTPEGKIKTYAKDLMRRIRKDGYNIIQVVVGAESGVPLADYLSEHLGKITNGTKLSKARRSKFLMHEALKEKNLRSCNQFLAHSLADAVEASEKIGYPVIAKPESAAGTEGVTKCMNAQDVTNAWKMVTNTKNKQGVENHSLLVQEFLDGTEYVVDLVSYKGHHVLSMIYVYEKRASSSGIAYDLSTLVEFDPTPGGVTDKLFQYAKQVADALEVRNGASHLEIMMVRGEPCLVELNARIHGGSGANLTGLGAGFEQAQWNMVTDVFLNRGQKLMDKYHRVSQGELPYRIHKPGALVYLSFPCDGILAEDVETSLKPVLNFPSVHSFSLSPKKGDKVSRASDLFSSAGSIILSHESSTVLNSDLQKIRAFEKSGFCYKINDPVTGVALDTKSP